MQSLRYVIFLNESRTDSAEAQICTTSRVKVNRITISLDQLCFWQEIERKFGALILIDHIFDKSLTKNGLAIRVYGIPGNFAAIDTRFARTDVAIGRARKLWRS